MSDNEKNQDDGEEQLELEPADSWPSRDKLFADLEENEEFEEPDRDSDYASVYTEVEEGEESGEPWGGDNWEENVAAPAESGPTEHSGEDTWAALSALRAQEQDSGFQADDIEPDEAWEDEAYDDEEEREITLPLGMIVVGIIALVLLGAGGYGVMQDRSALQEEIRQLQASLSTTASPAEVAQTRAASETLTSRNRELEQQVADLSRENRNLQSIIGGLESQLQVQQEALARSKATLAAPAPKTVPVAKKAVSKPAPTAPRASQPAANASTWFVNFGSYSQRATAEAWKGRLKPASGDVIVSTGEKDGRTFYRVRVINLASEEEASRTARKLEQDYQLSRLWVGRVR